MNYDKLIEAAYKVSENSYSPYSKFRVGAALLTKNNNIYSGCNVENSTFSSICAERNALTTAVANGEREFLAIAVVSPDSTDYIYPCGTCRQALIEFSPEMDVIAVKDRNNYKVHKASELLVHYFKL